MKYHFLFMLMLITVSNLFGQQIDTVNLRYKEARQLFEQEKYYDAIEKFNYCYVASNSPQVAFWLSISWANVGNQERCRHYYLIAKEKSSSLSETYRSELKKIFHWLENESSKKNGIEFSGFIGGSFQDSLLTRTPNSQTDTTNR